MNISLQNSASGRITIQTSEGKWVPVNLSPCFPWSGEDRFISLRDDEGNEHALIESIEDLSPDNQKRIRDSLYTGQFTFEISKIHAIDRNFELRTWHVDTIHGSRHFQTMLDDFPQILENGTILITDLAGDIYEIKDRSTLDKASQKRLWAFID